MVTHVDDNGFVSFLTVGGISGRTSSTAQRVEVLTSERPGARRDRAQGRQAAREPARSRSSSSSTTCTSTSARSDRERGARPPADRRRRRARDGEPVELAERPARLALARQPARRLRRARGGAAGRRGRRRAGSTSSRSRRCRRRSATSAARARASFALEPDVAIAVDVTGATDVPGGDPKSRRRGRARRRARSIDRGPTINPKVFELLVETAEAEGIALHGRGLAPATRTPTPTRPTRAARGRRRPGSSRSPTRYMHTPVEIVRARRRRGDHPARRGVRARLEPGLDFTR